VLRNIGGRALVLVSVTLRVSAVVRDFGASRDTVSDTERVSAMPRCFVPVVRATVSVTSTVSPTPRANCPVVEAELVSVTATFSTSARLRL
jgi:hypothetical protein